MKFKTFIPDSETRTVTSEIESSIELTDYYMVSHEGYYADIVDEKVGITENQLRKTTDVHLRNKICGYKKQWYSLSKCWGVEINMQGATENIVPCFKRESQAQEFCDALLAWILE